MFRIPASLPALTGHNPSRPGWTLASAIATIADGGPSGLAGSILAHGYDPSRPVRVADNSSRHTLATLASATLAGLDSRKTDKGMTKPVVLATDEEGKGLPVTVDAIRAILSDIDPETYVPETYIPAHGGGNNRVAAFFLACLYVAALKRDPTGLGILASVDAGSDGDEAAGLTDNMLDAYRLALTPWQKVIASIAILKASPILLGQGGESKLAARVGCKRGDAQLMHAGASAILKHNLPTDMEGRCPNKEEWRNIRECATRDEALAMLAKVQSETRAKAVGVDTWAKGLANLPEGKTLDARALAKAMEAGTDDAYNAFMQEAMK